MEKVYAEALSNERIGGISAPKPSGTGAGGWLRGAGTHRPLASRSTYQSTQVGPDDSLSVSTQLSRLRRRLSETLLSMT